MPFVKKRTCSECGKSFLWVIERPGDGYWDRWRNDNGETAASWFTANTRCFDHAMASAPEQFRDLLRTTLYEEYTAEG